MTDYYVDVYHDFPVVFGQAAGMSLQDEGTEKKETREANQNNKCPPSIRNDICTRSSCDWNECIEGRRIKRIGEEWNVVPIVYFSGKKESGKKKK